MAEDAGGAELLVASMTTAAPKLAAGEDEVADGEFVVAEEVEARARRGTS